MAVWCLANAAQAWIRTGDFESNRTLFLTDVKKYPTAIDLHRKSAQTYLSAGETDKAIEHFSEAIRLHPNYAHGHRGLGKAHRAKKDWPTAIAAYKNSYGQGYVDPPGAESIAFKAIGECHLAMAEEAKESPEKRRLIGEAINWFRKSLNVPAFGDSIGEAHNAIAFCVS